MPNLSHSRNTREVPKFKSRSSREGIPRGEGSVWGEKLSVVGAAETSKEEKWPQPTNPEMLSTNHAQTAQPDCISDIVLENKVCVLKHLDDKKSNSWSQS